MVQRNKNHKMPQEHLNLLVELGFEWLAFS